MCPMRMAYTKMSANSVSSWVKREPPLTVGGNVIWFRLYEK